MRPLDVAKALLLAVFALAGCNGPKDARYRPAELSFSGPLWPPDVIGRDKNTHGIFSMNADRRDTELCCWLAPQASLAIRKRQTARTLVLGIYIPKTGLFARRPQSITVVFSRREATFGDLHPGFHELRMRLPATLVRFVGAEVVHVKSTLTYAPLGSSGPHYGALLLSAYFE